jgi:GAF domain-containing protein
LQLTSVTDRAGFADEQSALRRVATLVVSNRPPDAVFSAVAREVARVFEVELTTVCRFERDEIVVISSFGVPAFPAGSRWPLDVPSLTRTIQETGGPARIDDFANALGLDALARDAGVKAAVGAPIVVGGSVFGSINIATIERGPFPADTEERLAAFTELVATAISNAEARRELQRIASEQEALRRAATLVASGAPPGDVFDAIATSAAEVFGVPFSSLIRVGPDDTATMVAGCAACSAYVGQSWTVPADDHGITRTVVNSCRPSRIEDHSRVHGPIGEAARALGVGSVVGAPVLVDGSVWGVLAVGAAQDGPPLPADAGDRLLEFTELVTTTLINAETREGLRRLADIQASLRRIATLVAEGATADELFAAVAREVSVVLSAPIVNVDRFELEKGLPASVVLASFNDAHFPVGSRWPLDGPGARASVYETGRPVRIEDPSSLDITPGRAAQLPGVRWVVGAPIVVDGLVWGGIYAGTTGDERIPDDAETRLADFTELVSTAVANGEAQQRVRQLLDEQAALRRVATLVAAEVDPEQLFSAVSDEVGGLLGSEHAAVGRFEPDGSAVVWVGHSRGAGVSVGARWPLEDFLACSRVYRTGRPARNPHNGYGRASGPVAERLREIGFVSTVGAPILVAGRVWGVLSVSHPREQLPADAEMRVGQFAELVATAIANAESRSELASAEARARGLAEEQAALRRVATLVAHGVGSDELFAAVSNEVATLFGAEIATIGRLEPTEPPEITAVGVSEGPNSFLIGVRSPLQDWLASTTVYHTGHTARKEVTAERITGVGTLADTIRAMGFFSTVSAPIVVEGELWGVVTASSARESLPTNTERRIERFSELVATAIASAQSRGELASSEARARALADEQAALRRVATLVARAPSSEELFSAVAREVATVLKVPGVLVERFETGDTVVTLGVAYDPDLTGAEPFFGVGTRMPLDPGSLAAQVVGTHRPARVDDYSRLRGAIGDAARAAGLGSGVAGPILVDGELWGEMCVFSRAGTVLPVGTENRLHDFIELVATAISNYEARAELAASEARARELANEQAALRRVATLVARGASPDALFSAVAQEVAGIIDIPVVGVHRYEADGTFTMLGIAGETNFTVGSRWPVEEEGIAGMILATGRPAHRDDYSGMPGALGKAVRKDLMTATVGVPIVVDGSIWGFMVAAAKPGRPVPPDTEARLARFTELVATAVSNATTRTDLLTSRARVVSAADETRRRLERDLHDGIQQWLVALALKARKAAALSGAGESPAQELSGLADDLVAVTDELREISRGIHPAILSDAGLDDALEALARRSAIRVDLDVSFKGRYDPTLEATVYYVVAESITNAVKHAQASTVSVCGGLGDGAIELEIKDHGVGGADPRRGTGLIGLKDRVETLGGTISFASPAGAGTTIRVTLPASPRGIHQPLQRLDEAASAPASG